MIPNGEVWHYIAVKKPTALLRAIAPKHEGDFYCLNCLHSFRTKNNLNLIRGSVEIKTFVVL